MIGSAFLYHNHTSYDRDEISGHNLDWQNQPGVYKVYPGIEPKELPSGFNYPEGNLSSLLKDAERGGFEGGVDIDGLSLILRLTYSLTASARHSRGDFFFRNVASAGALYPTEIYVAAHSIRGVGNGLYHFSIARHELIPLRSGNLSRHLAECISYSEKTAPILTFFLTAIFFRSAWKYRDRSYRYHLLDTGHVVEHLTLALKALGLPYLLTYDFDDRRVNHLLGLDENKEVSLAAICVPGRDAIPEEEVVTEPVPLSGEIRKASRVSKEEIDYPAIREIHRAGTEIVDQGRSARTMLFEVGLSPVGWTEINPQARWPESIKYAEAVFQRRSMRNFVYDALPEGKLRALIEALCVEDDRDPPTGKDRTICRGLLVGNAEGLSPGLYLLDSERKAVGLVRQDRLLEAMAHVCLDQMWLMNASVHFLFLTNLDALEREWGARGYRYAMMAAGRLGERLYVAATAMELGCCGIGAFYDGEAAELLGLNQTSRLLYLVALGPVRSGTNR